MAEHKRVRKLVKMELETRDKANLTNLMIKVRVSNRADSMKIIEESL